MFYNACRSLYIMLEEILGPWPINSGLLALVEFLVVICTKVLPDPVELIIAHFWEFSFSS